MQALTLLFASKGNAACLLMSFKHSYERLSRMLTLAGPAPCRCPEVDLSAVASGYHTHPEPAYDKL